MKVRALRPADRAAARALVQQRFEGSRYCARLLEQVDFAAANENSEYLGLLAQDDRGAVRGIVLFGFVAGAMDVLKIHALVGDALRSLLAAVIDSTEPVRLFVCELPDDATVFTDATHALVSTGFTRESRVPDFFGPGIALDLLTKARR